MYGRYSQKRGGGACTGIAGRQRCERRKRMRAKKRWVCAILACVILMAEVPEKILAKMPDTQPAANETAGAEQPGAPQTAKPSAEPHARQTQEPRKLELKNAGARRYSGGQKGIKYGKVKKEKVYHIQTYVTDEVALLPTEPSTFQVTGGISRQDVKRGKVKVTKEGKVICKERRKDKKQAAIVRVTSRKTGESIYVYLAFSPSVYCKTGKSQLIYQGKTTKLTYNYSHQKMKIASSNPRVAKVNKKGVVTARKKGTAIISAKVKGSEKNQVKTKIVVREEPWIVNVGDAVYSYEDLTGDLREIASKYRGKAALSSIGTSEDGRTIWCLRIGNPSAGRKIVIDAGIHAREWLNPQMLMRKGEEVLRQYADYKAALNRACLYVVPMINPDGVSISQSGFGAIRSPKLRKLCIKTKASSRTWKANARGVNLNFNFPGGWNKKGKKKKPDGISYPGEKASSEKETKAMIRFINSLSGIQNVLNYHSTGSILYWNYNVESNAPLYEKQSALAQKVNSFTGYRLMPKSISTDPNGGFGDWLIYNKKIPNVTIETGSVMSPLPHSQLKKITKENSELLNWFIGGQKAP